MTDTTTEATPASAVTAQPHIDPRTPSDDRVRMRVDVEIREVREESGYALAEGIAYPALAVPEDGKITADDASRIDTYKTWMAPDTLRQFAHRFLERGTGGIDSQHDHGNVGCIVESWYQREATERYPADVWVCVVKVLKADTIEALRTKTIRGFSIEFVGRYREAPLVIEGTGKVRTQEIVDPYPLTLSLVSKPATRLPFASVDQRDEGEAGAAMTRPEAGTRAEANADDTERGRAVLVRFDPPDAAESNGGPMTVKTDETKAGEARTETKTEATTATGTPATRTEAPASTASMSATMNTEEAATTAGAVAPPAKRIEDLRPEFRALMARAFAADAAKRSETRESCDWCDLEAVLASFDAKWTFNDAVWRYLYAAQSVFYECGYECDGDADLSAKIRKMANDLRAAILAACDALDASAAGVTRSEPEADAPKGADGTPAVRAGKALSKKNRERIQGAHDAADGCRSMLKDLLDETGDGGEAEGEGDAQACSEATERSLRAAHESELATLRAALAASEAKATEAMKRAESLTTENATLTTARDEAQKRLAEIEGARPAPRGTGDTTARATPSESSAREELVFADILYKPT